jgi:hypothetical protein
VRLQRGALRLQHLGTARPPTQAARARLSAECKDSETASRATEAQSEHRLCSRRPAQPAAGGHWQRRARRRRARRRGATRRANSGGPAGTAVGSPAPAPAIPGYRHVVTRTRRRAARRTRTVLAAVPAAPSPGSRRAARSWLFPGIKKTVIAESDPRPSTPSHRVRVTAQSSPVPRPTAALDPVTRTRDRPPAEPARLRGRALCRATVPHTGRCHRATVPRCVAVTSDESTSAAAGLRLAMGRATV